MTRLLPILPLRDIVVFPHRIVPLFVGHALGPVPRGDRFAVLATRPRAELDRFEAGLAADAVDDPAWNVEAWRRVERFLDT